MCRRIFEFVISIGIVLAVYGSCIGLAAVSGVDAFNILVIMTLFVLVVSFLITNAAFDLVFPNAPRPLPGRVPKSGGHV